MEKLSEIITMEYKYDSEEEREGHVQSMEEHGYECTGQVKRSDTLGGNYYWYAKFYKYY